MDFPENEDWRTRLLTEAEIAAALQKLSTEAAIELFQQQMFLRSQGLPEPVEEPQHAGVAPLASAQPVEATEVASDLGSIQEPQDRPEAPVNPLFQTADLAEVLQQRATAAVPIIQEPEPEAEPEPVVSTTVEPWPGLGASGLVDIAQPAPADSDSESQTPAEAEFPSTESASAAWWKLEEPEHPETVHPIEDQITDVIAVNDSSQLEPEYRTYTTEEIATAVNTPPLITPAVHPVLPAPVPDFVDEATPVLDPAEQANSFIQKLSADSTPAQPSSGKSPEEIAAELNARFGANKVGPDTGFLAAQIDHAASKSVGDAQVESAQDEDFVQGDSGGQITGPANSSQEPKTQPGTFGYVSEPITPAFIATSSEPVSKPSPILTPAEGIEQIISEYEESHTLSAQPNLVDQAILEVGGQDDDAPSLAQTADINQAISESGTRPASSLLATWNGTGALVALSAIGFLAGSMKVNLLSLLVGGFVALVPSGLGFGLSALAARRGRQPQQILARAAFGVRGAIIPASLLILARLVATAVVAVLAGLALPNFFPNLQSTFDLNAGSVIYRVEVILPTLAGLLVLGGLAALFRGTARLVVNIVVAVVSFAGSASLVALWIMSPGALSVPLELNLAAALGLGASVVAVLGLLWGTSAADESPDLRSSTVVPKLLAVGLLNWTILGVLALLSGFALSTLSLPTEVSFAVGVVYLLLAVFAIGNLTLRNAASLTGLGLPMIRGWFTLAATFLVAAFAAILYLRLGADGLWVNVVGYLPAVGVPVVAWLGVVGADTSLRRTDYHEVSLLRSYGFYGAFNWGNIAGWVIATAVGWGMISSNLIEFQWMGYLAKPFGLAEQAVQENLGIWIALVLGLVTPFLTSIPRVRQQEREVKAIEARRSELLNVLGLMD
ncbi:MAG: hypothetical protein ACKORF_01200 [Micrococcales bacterium]